MFSTAFYFLKENIELENSPPANRNTRIKFCEILNTLQILNITPNMSFQDDRKSITHLDNKKSRASKKFQK